jgi:hypothetical protein
VSEAPITDVRAAQLCRWTARETQMHRGAQGCLAWFRIPRAGGHLKVSPGIEVSSSCNAVGCEALSELDAEAALGRGLAFQLHQATAALEAFGIGLTLACLEHAHAVDRRGDRWTGAAAQVLAERPDAQIVIAARPLGLGSLRSVPRAPQLNFPYPSGGLSGAA